MILFLNHKQTNCGVYQLGKRVGIALEDTKYHLLYGEVGSLEEFMHLATSYKPDTIIYNFYPSTMPWLSPFVLNWFRGTVIHIGIFHEVPVTMFDYLIHIDPTFVEHDNEFTIGRLIPYYVNEFPVPKVMTVGTFGFGLGGKNYDKLVKKVADEFEEAVINLHIPPAFFGDWDGSNARKLAEDCIKYSGDRIRVNISLDFLPEDELLDLLALNTINAFYYDDMYGRGCASVTDYALAVDRPIAITKSYMFRHLHPFAPEICMEDHSLAEIVALGTEPLKQFMGWNKENLIANFERIYDSIKNARSGRL